jgi:hypothetical protein
MFWCGLHMTDFLLIGCATVRPVGGFDTDLNHTPGDELQ